MDIMPTLVRLCSGRTSLSLSLFETDRVTLWVRQLEMAQVEHPAPEYRGRKVLPMRGKSWVSYLSGSRDCVHTENAVHGWERECFLPLSGRAMSTNAGSQCSVKLPFAKDREYDARGCAFQRS